MSVTTPSISRLLLVLVMASIVACSSDSPLEFLEDNPEIRSHPDYPVSVTAVDHLLDEIIIERNVWVPMRDGTRLSANVFRPAGEEAVPVIMALTAYDKNKGPDLYPKLLRNALDPDFDLGRFSVSPWAAWEGPDPAYWVPHGYAVIYVDSRGFASSEGEPGTASMQDRDDFYDAIEWAGTQPWSNGNVGTNGVSYLAIAQWVAATGNPPHLKAIVPWEGQSDSYRDVLYHGGIPETAFTDFWVRKVRSGANGNPLPPPAIFRFAHKRPKLMRWIRSRTQPGIDLPAIQVPALICASWSDQGLHSRGSFEGYKQIASSQKWLFTHGRQKWGVYYSDEALEYQRAFYDHFLKAEQNGFDQRPSVRLEVRESLNEFTVREADTWPIAETDYQQLFLNAERQTLETVAPSEASVISYDALSGSAVLRHTFEQDTQLIGNMKLKLWVSTDGGNDMDFFVGINKINRDGELEHFFAKTGYRKGPVAMGWLRASERALDLSRSTPWQPWLLHQEPLPVVRNEVFPIEIEILPSATLFRSGESLELTVQGRDLFEHPALRHSYSVNSGKHSIYTAPGRESFLLVPVVE